MKRSLKDNLKAIPWIHKLGRKAKNGILDIKAAKGFLAQRRKANSTGPIRVGFLCQFIPAWSKLMPVYRQMLEDSRFQPVLICVPSNIENRELVGDTKSNDTYDYFRNQGYSQAVSAWDGEAWLDLTSLNLDYIFYPRPYNDFLPPCYDSAVVSRYCRICLVMYGMSMTEQIIDTVMERSFFRYVYCYFAESPYVGERNRKMGRFLHGLGLQKSVYKGLPGMEEIAAKRDAASPAWDFSQNSFRVIWTPRWTTDPALGGTNFFEYYQALLDYARTHENMDFLFRPHPLALENFQKTGEMTAQQVQDFLDQIQSLPNVSLDSQKEYFSTMWGASVLVTDISGIMPEYFATGKPMIYCATNMPLTPSPHTETMLEGCYTVYNKAELFACLEQLAAGEDPLAEIRQKIADRLYGGLNSTPSLGIVEELAKDREKS
ncbi:MAG: CDP-glycerol glycerophosphotransferase family protein [Oscillospiraceae bacterium]|nr:CDP-glycerol glycerophosphotransferase family protein [Oscillospiraceae bacterium]